MPRLISIPALVFGSAIELTAFELGGALSDAEGALHELRHFPVWLTVVGLGVWLARRDPARWVRAVLLHVPLIFLVVTLVEEISERASTGQPDVLDGTPISIAAVLLGALGMGLGALVAAWLEPGARARREALQAEQSESE